MPLIVPWWGVGGGGGTRAQLEWTDALIYNKASLITHEDMNVIDFAMMGWGEAWAQLELTDAKASVITHEDMYAIDFTLMGWGGGPGRSWNWLMHWYTIRQV